MDTNDSKRAVRTERYFCREFWGDEHAELWRPLKGEFETFEGAVRAAAAQNKRAGKGNRIQVIKRTLEIVTEVES